MVYLLLFLLFLILNHKATSKFRIGEELRDNLDVHYGRVDKKKKHGRFISRILPLRKNEADLHIVTNGC